MKEIELINQWDRDKKTCLLKRLGRYGKVVINGGSKVYDTCTIKTHCKFKRSICQSKLKVSS